MENLPRSYKPISPERLTKEQLHQLSVEKEKIRENVRQCISRKPTMRDAMANYQITEESLINTLAMRKLGLIGEKVEIESSSTSQKPRARVAIGAYNSPESLVNDLEMEIALQEKAHPPMHPTALQNRHGSAIASSKERLGILDSLRLIFEPKKPELVQIATKTFGTFQLDTKIFPPELKKVNKELLSQVMAEKIEAGGILYQEIINGKKEKILQDKTLLKKEMETLETISNLMWFLQAKAENLQEGTTTIGSFTSGSLSIADPNSYLTRYLDSSKEVYQRASSHIKEFQAVEGGVARGIDFNPGYFDSFQLEQDYLKNVLPYDKRTLMISPMLASTGLIEQGGNRVLLKMENYGCASPLFKDKPKAPKSRGFEIFKDFEHLAGHAWEFLLSLWRTMTDNQTVQGSRKERIPSAIKNAYKNLISECKKPENKNLMNAGKFLEAKDGKEFSAIKDFLGDESQNLLKLNPFSHSGGIRIMYARAKWLLEKKDALLPDNVKTQLNQFCNMLENKYSKESLAFRIGNEVIL